MDHVLAQPSRAPRASHKKESPGRKKILSSGASEDVLFALQAQAVNF